jgi:aminopeptidase N
MTLGSEYSHPEFGGFDFFVTDSFTAMDKDSLETSHPVSVDVNDPDEINAIFDEISYTKVQD